MDYYDEQSVDVKDWNVAWYRSKSSMQLIHNRVFFNSKARVFCECFGKSSWFNSKRFGYWTWYWDRRRGHRVDSVNQIQMESKRKETKRCTHYDLAAPESLRKTRPPLQNKNSSHETNLNERFLQQTGGATPRPRRLRIRSTHERENAQWWDMDGVGMGALTMVASSG